MEISIDGSENSNDFSNANNNLFNIFKKKEKTFLLISAFIDDDNIIANHIRNKCSSQELVILIEAINKSKTHLLKQLTEGLE